MELLIVYSVVVICALVIYLIKKNYLVKNDLFLINGEIKNIFSHRDISIERPRTCDDLTKYNHDLHSSTILLKSLRHLDFMSQLENYLDSSENSRFKEKVLSEFQVSKLETQVTVLKAAKLLSKSLYRAA